jgi:hypothetical protein
VNRHAACKWSGGKIAPKEAPMPATLIRHAGSKAKRPTHSRSVPELLLELAYRLHATRAVRRPVDRRSTKTG